MNILQKRVTALVVVVLVAVAAGCGDDGEQSSTTTTASPARTDTTTTTVEATADDAALIGTWRTGPITPADAEATLASNGLDEWVDEFTPISPLAASPSLVLEIGDGWDLSTESADGALLPIDYDATYEVAGDEVPVSHTEGSNTYRWAVEGDGLTREWPRTTLPDFQGVPEEVFQRALYQTAEFTRES